MTSNHSAELPDDLRVHSRRKLAKIVYVVAFLILGNYYFQRFIVKYIDGLVQRNRIGLWTLLVDYLDTGVALFLVLQMVVVMWSYRLGHIRLKLEDVGLRPIQASMRNIASGIVGGLAVFLAGLPMLLALDSHAGFIALLANGFFSIRTVLLAVLLGAVVPITTEVVFRGIVFKTLWERTSLTAALIASSVTFAYVWPVFDAGIAILLGAVTAILYYRSRSLLPAIVANVVVTLFCTMTLLWNRLLHG